MKNLTCLFILLSATYITAQHEEFTIHDNNLIYDDSTIEKLSYIVDSLNLKYKSCAEFPDFYSLPQGKGHFISLKSFYSKKAIAEIKRNISFDDFVAKFTYAKVKKDLLVTREIYTRYDGQKVLLFSEMPLNKDYGDRIIFDGNDAETKGNLRGPWIYKLDEDHDIKIFYIPEGLKKKKLSYEYSHKIGYADCLIDTSTVKIKEDADDGYFKAPKNWRSESASKQVSILDELRSQRVIGTCSMDRSPRRHAMYIALLAAETTNWEVFLKAHLDIMNDRFERAIDASYAWAERQTYLKELEVLDINTVDLIIGISLSISNPVKNHYNGSIGRIGRALADANDKDKFEKQIIAMISDTQLDDFNRVLFYYMFRNYIHHLEDDAIKENKKRKLAEAVETLPSYIANKIE